MISVPALRPNASRHPNPNQEPGAEADFPGAPLRDRRRHCAGRQCRGRDSSVRVRSSHKWSGWSSSRSVNQSASQSVSWLANLWVAARAGAWRRRVVSESHLRVIGSPRPARNFLLVSHSVSFCLTSRKRCAKRPPHGAHSEPKAPPSRHARRLMDYSVPVFITQAPVYLFSDFA